MSSPALECARNAESSSLALFERSFRCQPLPALICRVVRDGRGRVVDLDVVEANDAILASASAAGAGRAAPALVGTRISDLFGEDFLAPYLPQVDRVLATGIPFSPEMVPTPGGRCYRADVYPVGADLVAVVTTDITERRAAEEALGESQERYGALLDEMNEGAQILDRDWRWVYVNRVAAGHRDGELAHVIGRRLVERYPGIDGTALFDRFERVMEQRVADRFEAPFTFIDGSTEWFMFSVRPVPEGIFILTVNVTERHLAQEALVARDEALRRTTAELEEAREIAGLGVWRRDLVTGRGEWSPQMYLMFGGEPAETSPSPEAVERLLTPDTVRRRDAAMLEGARTGRPWELEAEVRSQDGVDSRWVLWRGVTEVDAEGRPITVRGTALDITARKRAELVLREFSTVLEQRVARRTAELEAANEELRSFSYSVSHDLRAPVRAIAGFARLLELRNAGQLDDEGLHRLHNIVTAGEQMGRVIDDLLSYSRLGRCGIELRPVELAPVFDQVRLACAALVAESGGAIELTEPLAVPSGDDTLVQAILLNLVQNALTYRRPGVGPRVAVAAELVVGQVTITVQDDGVGMPSDALERIFEPFVRLATDEDRPGTGIGLAIVRRSARLMGGDVSVTSEPGVGSTFTVTLPAA